MVRKWELGAAVPGGEALVDIAATGVNLNWLLTGEGEMRGTDRFDDLERLARAVTSVQQGLQASGTAVPPAAFGELVASFYRSMGGSSPVGQAGPAPRPAPPAPAKGRVAVRDVVITGGVGHGVAGKGIKSTVSHHVHHHGPQPPAPGVKKPAKGGPGSPEGSDEGA